MRFDEPTRKRFRDGIMARGLELATLLSQVLAGKRPPSVEVLLATKPWKRPEDVLRLALDQVERRRELLDAGDDRFGCCDVCGVDLGELALGEMPWADRCAEHAPKVVI
jgi:hypothetical protein